MYTPIQKWLDRTTMYRVVLYVLSAYVLVALGLSFADLIYFSVDKILYSLAVMMAAGLVVHYACAWMWKAPANVESTIITVLILFLIFDPKNTAVGLGTLALVTAISVISKYLFALRKLHLVNPVVFAAVFVSLVGLAGATWWVGNPAMIAAVAVGGLLITAKIRRWELVLSAIASALFVYLALAVVRGNLSFDVVQTFFLSWPIVFFATVMVTEPLSTPAGTKNHIMYGALVGAISSVPFHFGPVYSSPEMALLLGNLAFYPTTLRARLVLTLKEIKTIARDTYEYVFTTRRPVHFRAGQYLEWTMPHEDSDRRGIRRYFTIASSPTERDIKLGLKIPLDHSTFKEELSRMQPGDIMYATSLDGDFVLPRDLDAQPLVFIAGGIGITPFRSMVKYLIDTHAQAEVTLFNCNNTQADIPWTELWQEAERAFGMKTIDVLQNPQEHWSGEQGYITREMLERYIGDITDARYYISGPPAMVNAYKKLLSESGVPSSQVVTDFFPGLA